MRREIKCLRRMGKKGEEGRWGAKCKIDQTKSPSWIPVTNGPSPPIKQGPGPKAEQCTTSAEVANVPCTYTITSREEELEMLVEEDALIDSSPDLKVQVQVPRRSTDQSLNLAKCQGVK